MRRKKTEGNGEKRDLRGYPRQTQESSSVFSF